MLANSEKLITEVKIGGSLACSDHALTMKMVRGLEQVSYENSKKLRFFSLERRRIWEYLIAAFQYIKGA